MNMNVNKFIAEFSSHINEDDPYKLPNRVDLKNWFRAVFELLIKNKEERVPVILEILSQDECWENNSTIHRVRLNRRVATRKMIQPRNWMGRINPLSFRERYLVACSCCLEDDIVSLFQEFKEVWRIDDISALEMLEKELNSSKLAVYWTCKVSGYKSRIKLKQSLYEHGLNLALITSEPFVEAVEFFFNKIRSLVEKSSFSSQRQYKIIIETAIRAARPPLSRHPEILEFCISQMNPCMYPELLKRDVNPDDISLLILQDMLRLDLFQSLLDSFRPEYIHQNTYYQWLKFLSEIDEDSEHYVNAKVNLFMRVWMKEGFDRHRYFVLIEEITKHRQGEIFLLPFVRKNYMEPVWAILNKAMPDQIAVFKNSDPFHQIRSILVNRGDVISLIKLDSYGCVKAIPSICLTLKNSF